MLFVILDFLESDLVPMVDGAVAQNLIAVEV